MSIFVHTVDSSIHSFTCSNGDTVRIGYDPDCSSPYDDGDYMGATAVRRNERYSEFDGDQSTIDAWNDYHADLEEWENSIDELAFERAEIEGVSVYPPNEAYETLWTLTARENSDSFPQPPFVVVHRSDFYGTPLFTAIALLDQPEHTRGIEPETLANQALEQWANWAEGECYIIEIEPVNGETEVIGGFIGEYPQNESELSEYV